MKIIKRDGRAVDYDREKIKIAIEKANKEVRASGRANEEDIEQIIQYIEEFSKKRMLVEDIQDIIEEKLMEIRKYELAKKYIVYRYRRALVRKQNTTDESILGLIRNENKEQYKKDKRNLLVCTQRDCIAGEVSKDLTKRLLLPEKIVKAQEEGILNFHDTQYFVQPIINFCFINLEDMLKNGTVLNERKIKTPENFKMACIITTQIILTIANNQYGEQFVSLKCLGEYLRKSHEKLKEQIKTKYKEKLPEEIIKNIIQDRLKNELKEGIQIINYQTNNLILANGKSPLVTFFLHREKGDLYAKENEMIIEEFVNQMQEDSYKFVKDKLPIGKFNQGKVSINLSQIGITVDGVEEKFWKEFNQRLELCREALMCRHYALLGTKSDVSPIHWQHGAIARLKEGETIDKLLFKEYSTISLGYVGLEELVKIITKEDITTKKGEEFAMKVEKYLKDITKKWEKETNIEISLENNF